MVRRKLPPELENWLYLHYPERSNKELAEELTEMMKRENQKQVERLNLLLEEDFCEGTKKVIMQKIETLMEFKGISEASIKRYARILHCPKKSRKHLVYCNQGKARATNVKRWLNKAENVEHIMEWLRTFELRNNRCCIVEEEGKLKSMKVSINKYNRYEGYERGILLSYEYIPEVRLLRVYASSYR